MDEVYTCLCGNQAWVIHDHFIVCTKCNHIHKIVPAVRPKVFNFNLNEARRTVINSQQASTKPE